MRHDEAEAEQQRLQRADHQHTYVVREQPPGEWEIAQVDIPRPASHAAIERRPEPPTTDAELADAARRLKALRERRARLANVPPAPPESPPPSPIRLPPGFG